MSEFVLRKSCRHVAFIMDGNGRWASSRLLPRHLGHKEGIKRVVEIAEECKNLWIECMTLYSFSTENWNRTKEEIDHLFNYFDEFFDQYSSKFYTYSREDEKQKLLVVCSYSERTENFKAPQGFNTKAAELIVQNYTDIDADTLKPSETRVYVWNTEV